MGNVYEYTADKYNPNAYESRANGVTNPLETDGEKWVIRGGNTLQMHPKCVLLQGSHTNHDDWLKTDPQQPKVSGGIQTSKVLGSSGM